MTDFACSPEIWNDDKKFGDKMHEVAIPYYKNLWGTNLKISIMDGNEFDRKFSIDMIGQGKHNLQIYNQEKFQRNGFAGYKTITIEYMSNEEYKTPGAWFKMNIDYYIMGYATKDEQDFEYLWILKWNQFKNWLLNHFTEEGLLKFLHHNYKHSRASFLAIPINIIPKDIIKYSYDRAKTVFGFKSNKSENVNV